MTRKGKRTKYIFITGGVISSLGKGLAASAIGALMENRGLRISFLKMDPYINVDPGTMNPFQHGEVFVTDDGAETDLDLGHYERFTCTRMGRHNNVTSGQIYDTVIQNEREGRYLGGTVQVIPHITDEIKLRIRKVAEQAELVIVEVGGTVGDIEGLPFLEAIRQMRLEESREDTLSIHLTLVPYIPAAGELKSKPTQHSVQKLREIGIQPEILICRSDRCLTPEIRRKISLFCNIKPENVITSPDVESIYRLPLVFREEELDDRIAELLNIWSREPDLGEWEEIDDLRTRPDGEVDIGIVGKYVDLKESYKSLNEALCHGGFPSRVKVRLHHIDSGEIGEIGVTPLEKMDGILVPGGFGERGVEGKVEACRFAREQRVPFLGICLGLQVTAVEFARNALGMKGANSTEFEPETPHPVIDLMPEQRDVKLKGATMRLGAYRCKLEPGSMVRRIYGRDEISERHRHRYEFNNSYRDAFIEKGMLLSGLSPDGRYVEMMELTDHPWFIVCQFHPEYRSRPTEPHPLFASFIKAALEHRADRIVNSE